VVSKKRLWHSTDNSVGAKLECYYRCSLGGPFSGAYLKSATERAAEVCAVYSRAGCDESRHLTIDYVDMVLSSKELTYREELTTRWGADVQAAWLPEVSMSPTTTTVKILRKGAKNQPLSVRYLHAQLQRACLPGAVRSRQTELLEDIVVSHCLGLFSDPPGTLTVGGRQRLLEMAPDELFDEFVKGSRSSALHKMLSRFLLGVSRSLSPSMKFMMSRPSLAVSIPVPALAYRGIFRRGDGGKPVPSLTSSFGISSATISDAGAEIMRAVTTGATAKRAKLALAKLSTADQRVVSTQSRRVPLAAIVPLERSEWLLQKKMHGVTVWLCMACKSWRLKPKQKTKRAVLVDICRPGRVLCGSCGSDDVTKHELNGRMIVTSDPVRLCSVCGVQSTISALVPWGTLMVCPGCKPTGIPPCGVCGCTAVASTLGRRRGRYELVGLCSTHDFPADDLPVDVSVEGVIAYAKSRPPPLRYMRSAKAFG